MKSNSSWRIRVAQILLGVAIVFALVVVRGTNAGNPPVHLTTDWSHHHLVFSAPQNLGQHVRLLSNPRYVQQLVRRNAEGKGNSDFGRWHRAPESTNTLHGDWSINMGSGATVGAGNYPAKFSFSATSASCATDPNPDFVVYNTSLAGSTTQASIVAFDNLYAPLAGVGGCTGTVPSTYWAYNTGGTIVTSIVLSGGGDQVAFVQNTPTASLVLLKWHAGDGVTSPPTLTNSVSAAAYRTCTATAVSCMFTIAFDVASTLNCTTAGSDTKSSPFYDYADDVIYVGNDQGCLHKFTGVFKGTPVEVVATGTDVWPALLNKGHVLTSPVNVHDAGGPGVNKIFVGDDTSVLYRVDSTIGSGTSGIVPSHSLGSAGIDDSPLVDSSTGMVYVFERCDGSCGSPTTRAGVFQFITAFTANAPGVESVVTSTNAVPVTAFNIGNFDNTYYSGNGTTGSMYVCGTNAGLNALWRIPLNGVTPGVLGTPVAGLTLTTANVPCSPVTEFNNGAVDRIFLSVANSAVTAGFINCAGSTPTIGCIMSFDVTAGAPISTSAHALEVGGTSAIVVDGSVPPGTGAGQLNGASQVYFTPLANQTCTTSATLGGCAIQASQSGLI